MSLTPEQVQTIKATAPVLQQHGNTITTVFYANLLRENPDLNNIFNHANQRNNHQAQALAGSLYAYASYIDDLGVLSPAVEKICQKHASLYIRPEHYEVVGRYLLAAMGEVLGAALTKDILEAWAAAYWQLAQLMIRREEQLYEATEGWTDWRDFTVADKVKESEEITSFYLKPVDGRALPVFKPGQYISLLVNVPKFGYLQSRQYSLSDASRSDYYRVSIKKGAGERLGTPAQPGFVSNVMHAEKERGDIVKVSHPAGDFYLDLEQGTSGPIVFLSAGVGLTPLISMLNTLIARGATQPISFIHGARTTKTQAFGDHVRKLAAEHSNVNAKFFISKPDPERDEQGLHYHHSGRLDLGVLDLEKDLFLNDKRSMYFVCGPDTFHATIEKGLLGLGVSNERIKTEKFGTGDIPK